MTKTTAASCSLLGCLLAGCASITGLEGASSTYSCPRPDGVSCTPMSGVYEKSIRGELPATHKAPAESAPDKEADGREASSMPLPSEQRW
jgi:Type IV conjugative transfer system lipoprotein (TraV)